MLGEMRPAKFKGCIYFNALINKNGALMCRITGDISFPKREDDGVIYSYHDTFERGRKPTETLLQYTFGDNK